MDLALVDKTALVTGSTAGIGLAIATALAREGAKVIVNGRTEARVHDAIVAIENDTNAAKVEGLAADLASAEGVRLAVERFPDLDILVNNLGVYEAKPFMDITDGEWTNLFEVNVMSGVRLSRAHLPRMVARGFGRILFISSESGVNVPAEMIHYGVTKTAQLALVNGLAQLTKGTGVTVNGVLPGPTRSEGVEAFVESMATTRGIGAEEVERDFFETIRPASLLQRFAEPEEVASLVAYLASPLASATNGASMRVDGGILRTIG